VQQTPVTSKAFAAFGCLIEGETHNLNERHQHIIEKALNAGERAMAESGLLSEEKKALFQQNSEKKTQASARSTVVGTAKVMSYKDIVQARKRQEARPSKSKSQQKPAGLSVGGGRVSNEGPRASERRKAAQAIQDSDLQSHCHVFAL
jgi:hypothetical protein